MKVFEEILLRDDLFVNIEDNIRDIKVQMDYYKKENISTKGISLLPIRDLLSEHSDQSLQDKGYLLTVSDLKDAYDKCINLSTLDPVLANAQLKRWHHAFLIFTRAYEHGLVKNESAFREMDAHFIDVLRELYHNKPSEDKLLSADLCNVISGLMEKNANDLFTAWQESHVDKGISDEIHQHLIQQLSNEWQMDTLEFVIKKTLDEEKAKNHSTQALLQCFRQKSLPITIQNNIHEVIMDEINKDIRALHLKGTSALGAEIVYLRQNALKQDDYIIFSTLIANWQSGDLSDEVSAQLEIYIKKTIEILNLAAVNCLTQQFTNLAVNIFINKLKAGEYPKVINDTMAQYGQALLKQFTISDENETTVLPNCMQTIETNGLRQLHKMWVTPPSENDHGPLTKENRIFLSKMVFHELTNMDNNIKNILWSGAQLRQEMRLENKELRQQLGLLQAQLASIIKQLNPAQPPSIRIENSSSDASDKNNSKESSQSLSFFNK
ncbi:MAG: hypothetical protein K2Q14_03295 [Gammaproteobacteria bacterium]|nr:hypothetical protein [Gammaproteobacteria bacterium]